MGMGIVLPAAVEAHGRIAFEPVIGGLKVRMLAGKDEGRRQPALCKRAGDGGELDGFGAGADDDRDATGQPSP